MSKSPMQLEKHGRGPFNHKFDCRCAECHLPMQRNGWEIRFPKFDPVKLYRVGVKIRLYNEVSDLGGDVRKVLAIKV